MTAYAFRLVNVFAESRLAGNPLCVFEDGRGLDDATMQALALQFNLSETTFLLPGTSADARVRIFTPTFEMAFAGHPTLGSAHVVRALGRGGDTLVLEMKAGRIPVDAAGDVWTLGAGAPRHRRCEASRESIAAMLGLPASAVRDNPLWVDTGSEQLMIPLASGEAVEAARPDPTLLVRQANQDGRALCYVFAIDGRHALARFFFDKHGAVVEDPGTGSACANLGGWLIATGARRPLALTIDQGAAVGRPCRLHLTVDADDAIRVSGRVIEIGRGSVEL